MTQETLEQKAMRLVLATPGEDVWLDEIMKVTSFYGDLAVRNKLRTVLRAYRANLLSQPVPSAGPADTKVDKSRPYREFMREQLQDPKFVLEYLATPPTYETLLIQDLAMLVRRLVRNHPNGRLTQQAKDFLKRKDLEGNILRAAQDNFGTRGEMPAERPVSPSIAAPGVQSLVAKEIERWEVNGVVIAPLNVILANMEAALAPSAGEKENQGLLGKPEEDKT
jgi:hypothetical protein